MEENKAKKILVIEDEYDIRSTLVEILENNGFDPFSAGDGAGGIKLALEINPDLIICDIIMPGKDGHQVLKELNCKCRSQIPFIFLTAKSTLQDFRSGMQLGADDYIVKPFRSADLLKSINTRLKRVEGFKNQVIADADKTKPTTIRLTNEQSIYLSDLKEPRFIQVGNIVAIKANGDLTTIYLNDKTIINTRKTIRSWEDLLPINLFYRTHRTFIINSDYIKKIAPWFKRSYKVAMQGVDEEIFISERYASKLKKLLL